MGRYPGPLAPILVLMASEICGAELAASPATLPAGRPPDLAKLDGPRLRAYALGLWKQVQYLRSQLAERDDQIVWLKNDLAISRKNEQILRDRLATAPATRPAVPQPQPISDRPKVGDTLEQVRARYGQTWEIGASGGATRFRWWDGDNEYVGDFLNERLTSYSMRSHQPPRGVPYREGIR